MANAAGSLYEPVEWRRSGLLEGSPKGRKPWPSRRWYWLFPLALITFIFVAMWWTIARIEGKIERAGKTILQSQGIDTARLNFEARYRDLEVSGVLPSGTDPASLEGWLESEVGLSDGDRTDIREATVDVTVAAPAALGVLAVNAISNGDTVMLNGTVPSQAHRDALVSAVQDSGMEIVDELTVSGLEPQSDSADQQINRLSNILGVLNAGSFAAADLAIDHEGDIVGSIDLVRGADPVRFRSVAGDGVDVNAPPLLGVVATEVNYDGTRIVLNGTVLTDSQSHALTNAAAAVVGAGNVVDNLAISGLDPEVPGADDRVHALAGAIKTFSGLATADVTMNDTDMTVNGEALDQRSRQSTADAVSLATSAGLRAGGEISLTVAAKSDLSLQEEIDLLQAELDALEHEIRANVVFATASGTLTPAAQRTLDRVIEAMTRYSRPVVEVGGHTDNEGDAAYNESLSQRRAEAVVAYVSKSIDPDRLSPVGYGESQPIADNDLEEGRVQNRRVELIAKENF